jgi:predicted CoA-binding protein
MIRLDDITDFLSGSRLAVVGASNAHGSIGLAVYRGLRDHGYDVVPVNPRTAAVDGDDAYGAIGDVPGHLDGVVILVNAARAVDIVRDCALAGVQKVWLFKGLGGDGAASDEVLRLCADNGMAVVAGACPLMFLTPVHGVHRLHRTLRHLNHSLEPAR